MNSTTTPPAALDLLTPREVAAVLRLSESVVYRMLSAGTLPGIRIARRWRVRRLDLVAMFEGAAPPPAAPPVLLARAAPPTGRPGRPRKMRRRAPAP
jgi:excisionase family DNA binding protein